MKQVNHERLRHGTSREPPKILTRISLAMMLVGLALAMVPNAFSLTGVAAVPGEDYAVQNSMGLGLFLLGAILAILILGLYKLADWNPGESYIGIFIVIIVILLLVSPLMIGAAVYFAEPDDKKTFCEKNPDDPSCKDIPLVEWDIQLEADLDAAGATYPAAPMTVCDTAIGGTTGEWVAGDNGRVDMSENLVSTSVTIDTDLASTEALWQEPNCIFIETLRVQLKNGPKSSSGAIETQQYYARIDHISLTGLANDNESAYTDVFYEDTAGRHHLGYQLEDGSWVEACPEYRGIDLPTSGCAPIIVGTDDGTGDTTGAIASAGVRIFWVWEDRGPFSYRDTDGETWTLTFSLGSEGDWHTFTFIATMTESATDNT
ncbi:MAG: hypothetical protein ACW99U_18550 [Candidatus Thorarchaeota archaeon]|jgi:hypothetical protein